MYKKSILNNGLRLITHEMPHMQSVAIGVWVNAGSRLETEKNNGIAHFLEHLLFKGSRSYSCKMIKESIEGLGGSLNGFTSEEYSCYLTKLPHPHLNLALNILTDMILNPLLKLEDIETEKKVIFEEIKMHQDLPQSFVHQLLDAILWPGHALGMSILGSRKSVESFIRKDFSSFRERYYTPCNIVIAVCGNLDHNKILQRLGKIFKNYIAKRKNQFHKAEIRQKRPQLKISIKDTQQSHLKLGFHGLNRRDPDRFRLGLLHVILGANMSSRLFQEVREEKGLAYEIGTQVKYLADTGSFMVNAGVANKNVIPALGLILKELDKLKNVLVSKREFNRAKEFYIGQLSIALEDTLEHMFWIGESTLTMDKIFTLDDLKDEVNKIRREDLRSLAQRIFSFNNRNLALIGPLKDKEGQIYDCLRRK